MTSRFATILTCFGAAALASCQKATPTAPPAPTAPTAVAPAQPAGPFVRVDGRQEYALRDAKLQVWDLKAAGLKTLTAKLIVAREGKAETISEVEYKWDATAPPAAGRMLLLVQGGREFGAPNKRVPVLTVDFPNSPSHVRTSKQAGLVLDAELHERMSTAGHSTPLGRSGVLYAQLLSPKPSEPRTVTLGSDLESAVAASKGGGAVLAVTLDWTLQE